MSSRKRGREQDHDEPNRKRSCFVSRDDISGKRSHGRASQGDGKIVKRKQRSETVQGGKEKSAAPRRDERGTERDKLSRQKRYQFPAPETAGQTSEQRFTHHSREHKEDQKRKRGREITSRNKRFPFSKSQSGSRTPGVFADDKPSIRDLRAARKDANISVQKKQDLKQQRRVRLEDKKMNVAVITNIKQNYQGDCNPRKRKVDEVYLSKCEREFSRPNKPSHQSRHSRRENHQRKKFRQPTSRKTAVLDHAALKTLKDKHCVMVVNILIESFPQLMKLLRSEDETNNSDEFIFDLTCTLATACDAPSSEKKNRLLIGLKGSVFLKIKIPTLLDRVQGETTSFGMSYGEKLAESLMKIFVNYIRHFPSSYADLPGEQLERALGHIKSETKDNLHEQLDVFRQERDEVIRAERQRYSKQYMRKCEKPPNDFREIPVCPMNIEVLSHEKPFLRKNITKGQYEDTEHYLDVQFRLLREDFLQPLREGMHEITQKTPKPERKQTMKCYQNVCILDKQFTRSGTTYKVQFHALKFGKTRLAHSKRLKFGSLICLSKDNFQTMLFATVANSDPDELSKGRFYIRFIEEQDIFGLENSGHVFQMVESPAYFEAYRHVLKGLKELDEDSLPFKKYLAECSADVDPPNYLRLTDDQRPVYYDLSKALDNTTATLKAVNILQPDAWPSAKDLCLNNSQLEALKTAMTTEFSVIQGPPGTGKTYVGAKIVKCLLDNRVHWEADHASPMLMVCYTNHALDQFLEKVLTFVPRQRIVRVGGRSKSKHLETCTLKKCLENRRKPDIWSKIISKISENKSQIRASRTRLRNAGNLIMEFDDLVYVINDNHAQQLFHASFPQNVKQKCQRVANTFKLWLCNNRYMNDYNNGNVLGGRKERGNQDGSIIEDMEARESAKPRDAFHDSTDSQSWLHSTVNGLQCYPKGTDEQTNQELYSCSSKTRLNNRDPGLANVMAMEVEDETSLHRATGFDESRDRYETYDVDTDEGGCFSFSHGSSIEHTFKGPMKFNFPTSDDVPGPVRLKRWNGGKGTAPRKETRGRDERWTTPSSINTTTPFCWQQLPKITKRASKPKKLQIEITEKDICCLKKQLTTTEMMTEKQVADVVNIWLLSSSERLGLYCYWLECHRERCKMEIEREEQSHEQLCCDLEAVRAEEEEHALRRATVIGMTTSCAARYHTTLQRIAPKIVVIEEAAEIMEAHIVTSLSRDTEHVILIGDHKQLRPKAAVYELAQKYNLEISLFERMVMNKMECKCLTIQHRMRPEIAELTKRIYDHEIVDHESVYKFDDISGVARNLFFIDHCELEMFMSGTQSYCNSHEAEFLAAFCYYLVLQGYRKEQITVLTMYTGQVLELKKKMPNFKVQGVKICAVDDYQGEENDIILLSLVRSNEEQSIGFLKESNRICVALSRARLGLHCIGNFRLLSSQSKLWKEICDDLKVKKAIGEKLQLVCTRHKNINDVRTSDDFKRFPNGGCQEACEYRLECGHACEKLCHPNDPQHKRYQCDKQCVQRCVNEHQCQRTCHYSRPLCGSCQVNCEKELPCGHKKTLLCYQEPTSSVSCEQNCRNILECGHLCSRKCRVPCQCDRLVELEFPCKHRIQVLCREKDHFAKCPSRCERYLKCGHNCPGICFQECSSLECRRSLQKTLPCGHQKIVPCFLDPANVTCFAPCKRQLTCGHRCSGICGVECERGSCSEIISITLKCNHQQTVRCGGSTDNVTCTDKCNRQCKRGHPCQKMCHGDSACGECDVLVNMTITTCNHNVEAPCHTDATKLKCTMPCERLKVCDHPCSGICGEDCAAYPCKMIVTKTLHCGHTVALPCYKKPEEHECEEDVEVTLSCGHKKTVVCSTLERGKHSKSCHVNELKVLPCKHQTFLPCSTKPEEHSCKEMVEVKLPCGHEKFATCSILKASLQMEPCDIVVTKLLPCNHTVQVKCSESKERQLCKAPCTEQLSCGHPCPGRCGEDCSTFKCDKKVQRSLPCLGRHQVEVLCSDDLN